MGDVYTQLIRPLKMELGEPEEIKVRAASGDTTESAARIDWTREMTENLQHFPNEVLVRARKSLLSGNPRKFPTMNECVNACETASKTHVEAKQEAEGWVEYQARCIRDAAGDWERFTAHQNFDIVNIAEAEGWGREAKSLLWQMFYRARIRGAVLHPTGAVISAHLVQYHRDRLRRQRR